MSAKTKMTNTITNHIPEIGRELANYSGSQIIDRLGEDVIRGVVVSILSGGNVRALTESLTRRRLNLSNAALLMLYFECLASNENFSADLHRLASDEMKLGRLDKESKFFLNWLVGLTGKSVQNVLRSDESTFNEYISNLDESLGKSVLESESLFGALSAVFSLQDKRTFSLGWREILQVFTAIGAQTLTIRGSEKSMYGKFFEKLTLGSLLSVLGFHLKNSNTTRTEKVFWLSERGDKRESDATLIFKPGMGARFDIGFIGPGNTEISLDKVSRFEREIEIGSQKHFMSTIILVDRIGERSRIREMARQIDGDIVQMSMTYWVKETAEILHRRMGFSHPLLKMSADESLSFVKEQMAKVDLKSFIG